MSGSQSPIGRIPLDFGNGGTNERGRWYPKSIRAFCPFCATRGYFSFSYIHKHKDHASTLATARCAGCEERVELILVYEKLDELQKPKAAIMLPAPSNALEPMNTPRDVPERIVRAVRDAEAAFSAGLYSGALTNAGIALEGLLRNSLAEEKE